MAADRLNRKSLKLSITQKGNVMEAIEVQKAITPNLDEITLEEELEIILRDNKNLQRDIDAGKRAERYLKVNKKRMAEIMAKLMEV